MTDDVIVIQANGVLELVLNRPDKKNALNLAMYEVLSTALNTAAEDKSIQAVLVYGADGSFSAGNDLKDFAQVLSDPQAMVNGDNAIVQFLSALEKFPKPVIAAVDGVAVGIGMTLLLHCDMAYCSSEAVFAVPFVNLGLRPENACSYLLPRLVGHARASEWLLLGEPIPAEDAFTAGLVNRIVEDPIALARGQCEKICLQPPTAVRETKSLIKASHRQQVETSFREEIDSFTEALTSPEFGEAAAAFFEKRRPDFSTL